MNLPSTAVASPADEVEEFALPGRWLTPVKGQARAESLEQLKELGRLFLKSACAVSGLYLRICSHIRAYELDVDEVSEALKEAGFPPPRVSEIRRVAFAPEWLYREFMADAVGFRVALRKTRMYYAVRRTDKSVRRRKLRRALARVSRLLADLGEKVFEYRAKNCVLLVSVQVNITNTTDDLSRMRLTNCQQLATIDPVP